MPVIPISRMLGRLHKIVGESALGIYIALKLRNQCDAVIRSRLSDGPDAKWNGELLLLAAVAPTAQFFVDVGANVGHWAKSFLDAMSPNGSGLLFEPSPHTANRARSVLHQHASRIELVEAAIGDETEDTVFFAEPECGESSSIIRSFARPDSVAIRVRLTTLDRELAKRAIEHVDFLKVDAEGFDLKVLKGAKRVLQEERIGIVQFEYNSPWAIAGSTLAEAISLFENYNYTVFLLKADGLHRLNYRRYGEYFGYSNYVAVSSRCLARIARLIQSPI